jgi:hypothetical protein
MRLLRLYVGEHRVLHELDIRFDPAAPHEVSERKHHLDFLVGVNGTGKSTVLRLLGQIFRGVQASSTLETPFILEYWLDSQQKKVRIANIHPRDKTPLTSPGLYFWATADGLRTAYETEEPDEQHLSANISSDLLPARVIAYTTGNEAAWQDGATRDVFDSSSLEAIEKMPSQDRKLNELPGWVTRTEEHKAGETERFRFIFQENLVLVALAGLLLHHTYQTGHSPLRDVLKEVGLKNLAGFSLQFDLSYASERERGDVWTRLGQHATRTIRSGGKFQLVFDLTNAELANELLKTNGEALGFYEMLANWYRSEERILTKVTLFLERASQEPANGEETIPPLHTWDWLSDGERSFLGRMCLFLLFGEVESLILLDEPEVHFNDYWKRHIVSTMHEVFKRKNAPHVSHVLVATHSSISLSDVHPEDILILERQNLFTNGTSMPRIQTFGADPSEIMVHVFGAPHATGQYSVNEIEEWLAQAFQRNPKERRDYLQNRLHEVAPGYWAYRIRREMVGLPLQ